MKRGDIYYINSFYTEEGSEQRAGRPAVIVSNDTCNEVSPVVEIVYLTAQPKKDLPTHVFIRSSTYPSTVLCEQIHSISKDRIAERIGKCTKTELEAIDNALAISLGIDFASAPAEPVVKMREPTEEELQQRVEELQKQPPKIKEPEEEPDDTELVVLRTERNIYKKLYGELLESLVKGARA